jgi:hypothetical protein
MHHVGRLGLHSRPLRLGGDFMVHGGPFSPAVRAATLEGLHVSDLAVEQLMEICSC